MASALDPGLDPVVPPATGRQQTRIAVRRQRDRMARAALIWERQRVDFVRLLAEAMEQFDISPAEISIARREIAAARSARMAPPGAAVRAAEMAPGQADTTPAP